MKISNNLYLCKICDKKKQLTEYYTHKSGKQKGKRTTRSCTACTKEAKQSYRDNNKDTIASYRSTFYSKQTPEYFEQEALRKIKWSEENPEKVRDNNKAFRAKNKSLVASYTAKYRSKKLDRTPSWTTRQDIADIKSIYKMCRKVSEKTGIIHHVDHVIPIQGVHVSGLHVPGNLQILPYSENLSKGNTYKV